MGLLVPSNVDHALIRSLGLISWAWTLPMAQHVHDSGYTRDLARGEIIPVRIKIQ